MIFKPASPVRRSTFGCNFLYNSPPHQRLRQPPGHFSAPQHLELLRGLLRTALVSLGHSGSPFRNESSHPDSVRVRADSRYFLFQVSTKDGSALVKLWIAYG